MSCGCKKNKNTTHTAVAPQPLEAPSSIPPAGPEDYTWKDALVDTVTFKADVAPESIQRERLSICEACPRLQKPLYRCKKCGCMMRLKTRFAKASCPLSPDEDGELPRWLPLDFSE